MQKHFSLFTGYNRISYRKRER